MIDRSFWKGRRVLITGHTGFKGSWLSLLLDQLGATIGGYSLPPVGKPTLFETLKVKDLLVSNRFGDITDRSSLTAAVNEFDPDVIFHLAAQPLVSDGYNDPILTYQVNVLGTAIVLDAARGLSKLKSIVNVTTDKCYENTTKAGAIGFKEEDRLGGKDPYSNSKACSPKIPCQAKIFMII